MSFYFWKQNKRRQLTHISVQKRRGSSSGASCRWGRIPPCGSPWLGVSLGPQQQQQQNGWGSKSSSHPFLPYIFSWIRSHIFSGHLILTTHPPPQWAQQWRPKTERESKPPWRKSLNFPQSRNAAELIPAFFSFCWAVASKFSRVPPSFL